MPIMLKRKDGSITRFRNAECAWNNMSYLGLNRLPIGTKLYLTFAKKKSDSCYLRNVDIAE